MKKATNQVLVIFGASGDLTKRKLIPALFELYTHQLLPDKFAILGVSRTHMNDDTYRDQQHESLIKYAPGYNDEQNKDFLKKLYYLSINTEDPSDYAMLREKLLNIDNIIDSDRNYIFYLATPPKLYSSIAGNLASVSLNWSDTTTWKRIIIEKPFGIDLQSAIKLNNELHKHFDEEQIYRIDHYLGKETVQNILVTRFSNGIFEPLWNRNYISHIEISSFENIGVENRGGYYDQSGALRDMVQNHLMQIVGLTAMEPPAMMGAWPIRNEMLKVFQSLRPIDPKKISESVLRARYAKNDSKKLPSYLDEKGIDTKSTTETYVALKFFIDNWRWAGVPFFIRTGKCMPTRVTEIVIHFKSAPHSLFIENNTVLSDSNQLIIRIQPDEGLLVKFGMKVPGAGFNVQNVNMSFHYSDLKSEYLPLAYARLLLDCMIGDATLYSRGDAIAATWAFIDPILAAWESNKNIPLYEYPAGTWGPQEADKLIDPLGLTWRYPCRNLSNDSEFCEL